jgi:hypothetical protein
MKATDKVSGSLLNNRPDDEADSNNDPVVVDPANT